MCGVRESSVGVSKEVLQNEALKMLRGEQDKEGAGKADRSGPSRVGAGARGGKEGGKEAGALDEFCVDLTAQVRFRVLLRLHCRSEEIAVHLSLPVESLFEARMRMRRQRSIHHAPCRYPRPSGVREREGTYEVSCKVYESPQYVRHISAICQWW